MNPTSALQQQFPLSPRKLLKKILSQITSILLAEVLIGGFIGGIVFIVWTSVINPDVMNNWTGNNTLVTVIYFIVFILILFCIHLALYFWYVKTYIRKYYYAGEDNFITIRKGVITPAEIHVQWQKIQDVYVDQDILDRILGLYDVHIASATVTSGIEAHIDGVDQVSAEGLKKILLDKVSGAGKNNGQNAANQQGTTGNSPKPAASVRFSQEISNKTYPLSSRWMGLAIFRRFLGSFLFWAFLIFVYGAQFIHSTNEFIGLVAVWLIIALLSSCIHTFTLFLWKKNYTFNFGPDNLYYKSGVFSRSEKHMPYSSIQDISINQSFLDRIFKLASVRIENATQSQQIVPTRRGRVPIFPGIILQGFSFAEAQKITDELKNTILAKPNSQSQYGL